MTEEERHDDQGQLHHASDASVAATHPDIEDLPVLVAPATGAEFNTLRAPIIPKACFKLEDSHFDFDSSFVSPVGLTFNAGPLKDLLDKHLGAKLSIFGHADPVGRDDYNKTLSGRRAQAIFGLLVRDPKLWEDLYFHHDNQGKDKWGVRAIQIMLNTVGPTKAGAVDGILGDKTRKALKDFASAQNLPAKGFNAKEEIDPGTFKVLAPLYMDAICLDDDGNKFMLTREDFLARGKGKDGKGDIQGCGEFNSILLFSKADKAELDKPENHQNRNSKNTTNRRVMILLFKPGSEIDPAKWPCPTVKEGVAGCKARFFSDGEQRRSNQAEERKFDKTKDTFACRFYHRLLETSPCEKQGQFGAGKLFMQIFDFDGMSLLTKRKYKIERTDIVGLTFRGRLSEKGILQHDRVPSGDYLLRVEGCAETTTMVVLEPDDLDPQVRFLETGHLTIHVQNEDGAGLEDAIVVVGKVGRKTTNDQGVADFGVVDPGVFEFSVSKKGFESISRRITASLSDQKKQTVGASAESSVVEVTNTKAKGTAILKPSNDNLPRLLKLVARQGGTASFRGGFGRGPKQQLPETQLHESMSSETDFSKNPPVILVKGSLPVFVNAETDPPGQVVTWEIISNQNTGSLTIDPQATFGPFDATIQMRSSGAFSAIAKLGNNKLVWNFVIIAVEVDLSSTITERNTGFMDLGEFASTPEGARTLNIAVGKFDATSMCGVASGVFEFGKHPWSSKIKVSLKGGGTDRTFGCDRIKVHIIQNIISDQVVGEYQTQLAITDGSPPFLDTSVGSPDGYVGPSLGNKFDPITKQVRQQTPFCFGPGMVKVSRDEPTTREFEFGDSPAVGFKTREGTEKLKLIRGHYEFRVAVVTFSLDSKNAIVAHADAIWKIDYTGEVEVNAKGKWEKTTAAVTTLQRWKPIQSSSGIEGTDAANSTLEIHPPLFTEISNSDKKVIKKA